MHPSVNETAQGAAEQEAVRALGTTLSSLLFFTHDANCDWEIDWHRTDLSGGFWRAAAEAGKEHNFAFQLPRKAGGVETRCVVPSSLQMGWKNSPAFFCSCTESMAS
jgi:hypothetical protein